MDKKAVLKQEPEPSKEQPGEDAASKAEAAAEAKADELRTMLECRGEQGKSSLGYLPPDEG
jgi:hypothetical protein